MKSNSNLLNSDGNIERFVIAYRFYTSDTDAVCYYDSITFEYVDSLFAI